MWSACATGASHHGIRQVWSRHTNNWRSRPVNVRLRASMATNSPLPGRAYSRVSHTRSASRTKRRASTAGTLPNARPSASVSTAASSPPRSRVCSDITSPTSMFGPGCATTAAPAGPVSRWYSSSDINCPTPRPSPALRADTAWARSPANAATAWATGMVAVNRAIAHPGAPGAGRTVTRR